MHMTPEFGLQDVTTQTTAAGASVCLHVLRTKMLFYVLELIYSVARYIA
jgi:hypothetical protein